MVQGYYTLQEAAQVLSLSTEELKTMTQKGKIRSFQDRGTLRFRIQDIQELARLRGSSDLDVPLSPPAPPKSSTSASQAKRKSQLAPKTPPKQAESPSGRKSQVAPRTPPKQAESLSGRKSQTAPKTPSRQADVPDVFDFDVDSDSDSVDLGADFLAVPSGLPDRGSKKVPTPPQANQGSDSDVRLVADGSDVSFTIPKDSNIHLADSAVKLKSDSSRLKTGTQTGSGGKRSSQVSLGSGVQTGKTGLSGTSGKQPSSPRPAGGASPVDSGVRLVPLDDDSDVKLLGSSDDVPLGDHVPAPYSDSNVRLDRVPLPPADSGEVDALQTEEINLDEEMRHLEERDKLESPTKMRVKSELKFPTTSPFELSDSELQMPPELADDSGPKTPMQQKSPRDSSSDFDLTPADHGEMLSEDSDFSLELPEDPDQVLDQPAGMTTSASSGISLDNPVDAGISLEEPVSPPADEELDFDLSLEVEDTPRPAASQSVQDSDGDFELQLGDPSAPAQPAEDGDSQFELSLTPEYGAQAAGESSGDIDLSLELDPDSSTAAPEGGDSSEFELSLADSSESEIQQSLSDSDSEFELTLDDSGNLPALEVDDEAAPQIKSKKKAGQEEEGDIFETDFEVPALEGEAEPASTDLESSDFDLALDDSELAGEEESGSQVVALDEEEDAETLVDSDGAAIVDDLDVEEESSDFGDLDADTEAQQEADGEELDEEGETVGAGKVIIKEKLLPAAPWGPLPVVFMLPCAVIMFLVGILGYEMMQHSTGVRPPGPLTLAIADMLPGNLITLKK